MLDEEDSLVEAAWIHVDDQSTLTSIMANVLQSAGMVKFIYNISQQYGINNIL